MYGCFYPAHCIIATSYFYSKIIMPTIRITSQDGETKQVDATSGYSLMETLRDLGYEEILALCGGCCSCATCHVHVDDQNCETLPPVEDDEQMLIEMTDNYKAGSSRLSCQIELTDQHDGLQVTMVEPE